MIKRVHKRVRIHQQHQASGFMNTLHRGPKVFIYMCGSSPHELTLSHTVSLVHRDCCFIQVLKLPFFCAVISSPPSCCLTQNSTADTHAESSPQSGVSETGVVMAVLALCGMKWQMYAWGLLLCILCFWITFEKTPPPSLQARWPVQQPHKRHSWSVGICTCLGSL